MAEQLDRVIYLLKKFQNGGRFTSKELLDELPDELSGVSLRTIQRDIVALQNCEPNLTSIKSGKEVIWEIPRKFRSAARLVNLSANELLSFYVLKAHLKTFSGTMIEEEVNHLTQKLEEFAPSEVYSDESLYWDQNIGQFNYQNFDPIIRRVLTYTAKHKWVDISYNPSQKGEVHKHTVMFRKLFTYAGYLYVVAYLPKHDSHIALTIQNIEEVEENNSFTHKIPEFDFRDWQKNRFGVFYGEIRLVELKIKKEFKHYFTNRYWHQTQQETNDEEGNLILKMKIPLSPDFTAWVLSWSDAIKVIRPTDLIKDITNRLNRTLKNYE